MGAHATHRPPSGAHRWLSCFAAPTIAQLYPNEPSEASIKGDEAHKLLDTAIVFGVLPDHADIDLVYSAMFAYERVIDTYEAYKAKGPVEIYSETQLDIPETGEFGTSDIIFVTPTLIHIIDYKNGYVPVNVRRNPQLMTYLLGAIARWGERKHYKISVIQPNYVHTDGMFRHDDVTPEDIEWFRNEVQYAMLHDHFVAGKHCKETYCPHRGSCEVFLEWSRENLKLAYFPGEVGGMSDEALSEALDQADVLQGWQNALRGEALRRIVNQDKSINGYKVVRGKKDRDFANEKARDMVFDRLRDMGVTDDQLYTKTPVSVAGVERIIKGIFKPHGRNAWVDGMVAICGPEMLDTKNQSLTVEKSIDGRKPYRPGGEFTPLKEKPTTDLSDIL